jgi:predicted PurR-regulated permease PerM
LFEQLFGEINMTNPPALLPPKDVTAESRLLTLVSLVVVIAGLYFGRQVLMPLALAVVFAFLLTPIVEVLEKYRLGRVPSVLTVLVLAFALLGAIGWGVSGQLMQVIVYLPDYKANIQLKIDSIRSPGSGRLGIATATVNDLSKALSGASETAGTKQLGRSSSRQPISVQVTTPPHTASEYFRDIVGPLTGILETAGIVVIFTLFILVKREDLRNRLFRLAGSNQLSMMTQALDDASRRLGRYLLLQFVVNGAYGLLFGVGLYFIGVPNPLLWGVLASLLRFVPYVGTPMATLFPMVMALAVFPGWSQVGFVFALFLCLELITANLIEPWLYGAQTGISSLAILVAAIFWAMLWGPLGLILSTPLTVCLIVLGRYVPQLTFLEILLGDEPVLSPQAHFYQRLLALDDEEAREIADRYLKENALAGLYDGVVLPALGLAEKDRRRNTLDETRTDFIYQRTRELIEELYELSPHAAGASDGRLAGPRIVCFPARDLADEIVATMAMQLLREEGHNVTVLAAESLPAMLDKIGQLHADIVCVSALTPFAAGQARLVCKQLRERYPDVKIVLGLWGFPGGLEKAKERVGPNCTDLIGTSLAEAVLQVNHAANSLTSLIPQSI